MHSARLDYYKGNFTQFHSTKSERERNLRKEYDSQLEYRQHLQAFIDRWRYNANRGASRTVVCWARALRVSGSRAGAVEDQDPREGKPHARIRRGAGAHLIHSCRSSRRPRRRRRRRSSSPRSTSSRRRCCSCPRSRSATRRTSSSSRTSTLTSGSTAGSRSSARTVRERAR
jgi:ATPase subunit of ABC transporter with duplicated ATPase domains